MDHDPSANRRSLTLNKAHGIRTCFTAWLDAEEQHDIQLEAEWFTLEIAPVLIHLSPGTRSEQPIELRG